VVVDFEFLDSSGNPTSSLNVGEDFTLQANVQDGRNDPEGVLRAYFDLTYQSDLASVQGSITHGPSYNLSTSGDTLTPGLINEVGGLDSDAFPPTSPGDRFELFSLPFRAENAGSLTLTADAADVPSRDIRLFDFRTVPLNEVQFLNSSIEIIGGAGINVTPTSGLTTNENGGTATFDISLSGQPTANVTIGLSSSDLSEGTVAPSSVTFTTSNFNTPQTITVTGVNDDVQDGDIGYAIVTAAATSGDSEFNGLNPDDVSVTNLDRGDTAGISVTATTPLTTIETGTTATFQIVLDSEPTANVTIPISSSDTTEGAVSTSSVTFTPQNWDAAQTITVTGVNDTDADGDVDYSIILGQASSGDSNYDGRNPADLAATNQDEGDEPGFLIQPTSGLTTTEGGGTATFQVRLISQPNSNVTIGLSSSDPTEATASPASLTFTPANWDTFQTVTATGVNDDVDDDDVIYMIVTGAAISNDSDFNGINPPDVTATNADDTDDAGITVTATTPLMTSELGVADSFQVVLNSQPTANVTIPVSSSDTTEGTVSTANLSFTTQNWNVAQSVTVTGVNDSVVDNDVSYTIILAAASSGDSKYNGLNPDDLAAINEDEDVAAGFFIQPTSGLTTSEDGGTAPFQIRLTSQPSSNVTIGLSSSDPTEGTVSPASVTFTPQNWNVLQTVTAIGVNDDVDDAPVNYSIVTAPATGDAVYAGMNPVDVSVTNIDDDVTGFMIVPTSGLITDEMGRTATFDIKLTSQPTANVTIPLSTSDATEATVSQSSVTFTPQNWDVNETITVTGVNDDVADGNIAYEIVTGIVSSTDATYGGQDPTNITATNSDEDVVGFQVVPTSGLTTTEMGGTAQFTIRLISEPTANVVVQLSSSDTSEGTVSPSSVTFTPANWDDPQSVTSTGVNDDVADGDMGYLIVTAAATSSDANYNGENPPDVSVTNIDEDPVGVFVNPTSGLMTTEDGGTATFEIRLLSEPTANVTIPLSSSDETEATVSTSSVTFSNQNWDAPQTVTLGGVSDFRADGNIAYQILTGPATSADTNYNGFDATDVAATNIDTGPDAGFNITPTSSLSVMEDGPTSDTFQVSLTSQPFADVVVTLASSDTTEGTVSPATLTFNDQNWNAPQTVTVNGVDDQQSDGDVLFMIQTSAASQDPDYSGLDPADVAVVNINDDPLAITVSPTTGLQTSEAGAMATFSVVLTSQPTADVTVGLASSNSAEGTVSTPSVTFTTNNWDVPQSITVMGVDDQTVDGDQPFTITTAAAMSSDPTYAGFDPPDVSVTNTDDDSATLTLSAISASQDEGTGGPTTAFTFQVALSNAVAGGFDVSYSTSDGTATTADADYVDDDDMLSFAGTAGEIETITVQVNQDNKVEGDEMFTVALGQLANIATALADRITVATDPLAATIVNDDTATLSLSPISDSSPEGTGGTTTEFTFAVTLSAPVQGSFDVSFLTNDGTATTANGDYVDNDGMLSFVGTANEQRTITVSANHDARVEGDETFTVALDQLSNIAASVADSITIDGSPQTGTILNDDTGTLTLTNVTPSQQEGSDGSTTDFTFDVMLSNDVQGGFDLAYTTDDGTATVADGDYIDNDATLNFAGTANETQTITVQVDQDLRIEPDEMFQVALGAVSGTDATIVNSISINGGTATSTILNDDVPRLVLELANAELNEGSNGSGPTFTFTVTLSDDVADPGGFDVAFATNDGTATLSDGDYTANSDTLHFTGTAGEMQTITVEGLPDQTVEGNETLGVALGEVTGLEPGIDVITTGTPATATILNDDTATLSITALNASQDEGTGGAGATFDFEVVLSNSVQGGFNIDYSSVDGAATVADGDYVANMNSLSFTGNANETQTVVVVGNADSQLEADEMFQVMLDALNVSDTEIADSITLGGPASATLINDDSAELTLTPVAASQEEGTGGTTTDFTFDVTLSNEVQGGLTIAYTANDGTATVADSDYVDNDDMLTFAGNANETRTITVQVNHDQQIESNETFNVMLGAVSQLDATAADDITVNGGPVGATILNDDFPRLVVSSVAASQEEGSDSSTTGFEFTVTLSDPVADPDGFDVSFSTNDGTATAGADYTDNDSTLHFDGTVGQSHIVVVQVHHDEIVESDETFTFSLNEITGLVSGERVDFDGSPLTATIANDDLAMLSLMAEPQSQNEGSDGGTADYRFTVTLSSEVQGGFSIAYTTIDGSATTADNDYVDNDATLSFAGNLGETQTFIVQANSDNQVELDESFQVVLGELSNVADGTALSITIDDLPEAATIVNDDTTTITVSAADMLTEGTGSGTSDLTFEVLLSNPVQGGFSIGYTTDDGTATVADNDYIDNDATLTFAGTAGEAQSVVVQVNQDAVVERNEALSFQLTELSGIDPILAESVTVNGGPLSTTIENDDTATVSFASDASSVIEANGTHTVQVVLGVSNHGSLSEPIVVNIAALPDSTALTPDDFSLDAASVTFEAGSQDGATRTVALTIQEDELMEEQETINLQLSVEGEGIDGAVMPGMATHNVTVTDDPMTGIVSGIVWADTNNNGTVDDREMAIPGVTIRLTGQDSRGQVVEITTMTATDGTYVFDELPGGTYTIIQTQPPAFHDGQDVLGMSESGEHGQAGDDQFIGIVIQPAQQATGYNFGEVGVRAQYITNRMFLASSTPGVNTLREVSAKAEEQQGNTQQAAVIRRGEAVEVRRIGSQVTITGTSRNDTVRFTPATDGQHTVEADGLMLTFQTADVNSFIFDGAGGDDDLTLDDTSGDEQLTVERDRAILASDGYRAEAVATEFVQAISNSGGNDSVMVLEDAVDFILRLEGDWT
jgi:hypothetical protein